MCLSEGEKGMNVEEGRKGWSALGGGLFFFF